uniref:beta-defensin 118-like n=1 Tax=Arvicanthis niloticus TaxID=61156 RepID=UPI00148638DB|nr:beta-defensin 118-like [Arvicanthis niloticus]
MRLLLLTLLLLTLLPQVIPDYGADKRCSRHFGICRNNCKEEEVSVALCKHYRLCCVPDTSSYNQKASSTGTTKETITIEYDMSSDFMDVLT